MKLNISLSHPCFSRTEPGSQKPPPLGEHTLLCYQGRRCAVAQLFSRGQTTSSSSSNTPGSLSFNVTITAMIEHFMHKFSAMFCFFNGQTFWFGTWPHGNNNLVSLHHNLIIKLLIFPFSELMYFQQNGAVIILRLQHGRFFRISTELIPLF